MKPSDVQIDFDFASNYPSLSSGLLPETRLVKSVLEVSCVDGSVLSTGNSYMCIYDPTTASGTSLAQPVCVHSIIDFQGWGLRISGRARDWMASQRASSLGLVVMLRNRYEYL